MFSQAQKAPDYGTPFYRGGGRLPKYQANNDFVGNQSEVYYADHYKKAKAALAAEEQRVSDVNTKSLQIAGEAVEEGRDITRPLYSSIASDAAAKKKWEEEKKITNNAYVNKNGGLRCYGDTCVYSSLTMKTEAGAPHRLTSGTAGFCKSSRRIWIRRNTYRRAASRRYNTIFKEW